MHVLAADVGACFLQDPQRFRIVPEHDADFVENRVGVALDQRQPLLAYDLVIRYGTRDVGDRVSGTGCAGGALGVAAMA